MGEANSLGKDLPITRTHESVFAFPKFVSNNPKGEADSHGKDLPVGWHHESVTTFKDFVSNNPNLVEVQGLEGKDGSLLTDELLQVFFESSRFAGGGRIKKIYVSEVKKAALLTFSDEKVALELIAGHYMYFHDRILTVTLPTPGMCDFKAKGILVRDFAPLKSIQPGGCIQQLKELLLSWFASIEYRTENSPGVVDCYIYPESHEAFVTFEDFIDALHVMRVKGAEGIVIDEKVIGTLEGPFKIPSSIQRRLNMTMSMQESMVATGFGLGPMPQTSAASENTKIVRIKKKKLGLTLAVIKGLIAEHSFNTVVSELSDKDVFLLDGQDSDIMKLLQIIQKKKAPQIGSEGTEMQLVTQDHPANSSPEKAIRFKKQGFPSGCTIQALEGQARELGMDIIVGEDQGTNEIVLQGRQEEIAMFLQSFEKRNFQESERDDLQQARDRSAAPTNVQCIRIKRQDLPSGLKIESLEGQARERGLDIRVGEDQETNEIVLQGGKKDLAVFLKSSGENTFQESERKDSQQATDMSVAPTNAECTRITRQDLPSGFKQIQALEGQVRELGLNIEVGEDQGTNEIVLQGRQEDIAAFLGSFGKSTYQGSGRKDLQQARDVYVRPTNVQCTYVRRQDLPSGLKIESLEGQARELGLDIRVGEDQETNEIVLKGRQKDIVEFLESFWKSTSQESERKDLQQARDTSAAPTNVQSTGFNYGIEETQKPHPVIPTDFLGEHKLAEEQLRKHQYSKVPEKKDENDKILDFVEEKLPNGTTVFIYTEDLTKVKVDVIVNAANGIMKHAGGIAQAIARAAGYSLDQQCQEEVRIRGEIPVSQNIVTTGGNLCCKVIHVVGPNASGRKFEVDWTPILTNTFLNAFKTFMKIEAPTLQSIAIPAVSSGVYGVPVPVVAKALKEAVYLFDSDLARKDKPKIIHLVNILPETTHQIIQAFRRHDMNETKSMTGSTDPKVVDARQQTESIGSFPARHRLGQRAQATHVNDNTNNKEVIVQRPPYATNAGSDYGQYSNPRDFQIERSSSNSYGTGTNQWGNSDSSSKKVTQSIIGNVYPMDSGKSGDNKGNDILSIMRKDFSVLSQIYEDQCDKDRPSATKIEMSDLLGKVEKFLQQENITEAKNNLELAKITAEKWKPFFVQKSGGKNRNSSDATNKESNPRKILNADQDSVTQSKMQKLNKARRELKGLHQFFKNQFDKEISKAPISATEKVLRDELLDLLGKVEKFIREEDVVQANNYLELAKIKAAQLEKITPQNSRDQEEPMDTDERDSSDSSYEFVGQERDFISDDESNTDTQGAVARKSSSAKKTRAECCICLEEATDEKQLEKCKHIFCRKCIDESFAKCGPKCPLCGTMYGKMKGTQPDSGRMEFDKIKERLPGYPDCGTIVITYHFPDGYQKADHPNPGRKYTGTNRTAYLPDNKNGNRVFKLLKQAFEAKLVFTVGQSVTTGREDQVVWNNIHHKTSKRGGPQKYGYPDPSYLTRVLAELAAFGIK